MFALISLAAGLLFGGGLAISGLLDPRTIYALLSIGGGWRADAAIVFVVAAAVTMAGYRLVRSRAAPLLADRFDVPSGGAIDGRLTLGAALFGLGWGIAGICPGPAIAGLLYGHSETVAFLATLLVGLVIARKGSQFWPRLRNALVRRQPALSPSADVLPGGGISGRLELRKWIVVAAATFGMMAAFGLSTSIAVFMKPLEAEFGWLRADVAFAFALFSAGAALGGLIYGRATDWIDTRPIVVVGALVMGASFVVLAHQDDLVMIQYIYLAAGIFGFACLYAPLAATVGLWFERRRGLAIGIVTAGGTLGQGLTPILVQPLIEAFGWRQAYLTLGIVYLVLLVPAMWLVTKPRLSDAPAAGATPQKSAAWSLPPVVSVGWLGLAATFCCASMAVPIVHLVPFLADSGRPVAISGALIMTVMLSASVGRVSFGLIADRIGALRSYALAVFVQSITVYWFVELQSLVALYALGLAFGFGYGGVMTALILSVREAVPARSVGLSTAIVGLLAWGGMGLGGYQGGLCYDLTGNYDASFASAALAGAANLLVLSALALHLRWHRRIADALGRMSVRRQMDGGRLAAAGG